MSNTISLELRARRIADARPPNGHTTLSAIREAIFAEALKQLREVAGDPKPTAPFYPETEEQHF